MRRFFVRSSLCFQHSSSSSSLNRQIQRNFIFRQQHHHHQRQRIIIDQRSVSHKDFIGSKTNNSKLTLSTATTTKRVTCRPTVVHGNINAKQSGSSNIVTSVKLNSKNQSFLQLTRLSLPYRNYTRTVATSSSSIYGDCSCRRMRVVLFDQKRNLQSKSSLSSSPFSKRTLLTLFGIFHTTTMAFVPTFPNRSSNQKDYPVSSSSFSSTTMSEATKATVTDSAVGIDDASNNSNDAGILDSIAGRLENSWIRELSSETTENLARSLELEGISSTKNKNRTKRPVFNGHYVLVEPTGLTTPRLILYSPDVAHNLLEMTKEQVQSTEFVQWVSGNLNLGEAWATPYALSIMGTRYTSNCPYGTGNGYGDGRAISIGELNGYELQLKGAGTTPFCRGADGRAVLRSSIREFLASEAMHYLNVPTTRALSLIVSTKDRINRPWYSDGTKLDLPDIMNDPRLQLKYTIEERKQLISQVRETNRADPNIMQSEPAAITCRVATSFTRIGHFDLFARRVTKLIQQAEQNDNMMTMYPQSVVQSLEWKELVQLFWHACYREYRDTAYIPFIESNDLYNAADVFLKQSAKSIATMIGHWIRVGFVQGNFNADNCLVGGKTMDYGPFGYVDEYNPVAAKWTGSGQHFGFMNQPNAGLTNYQILVESVAPLLVGGSSSSSTTTTTKKQLDEIVTKYMEEALLVFENVIDETFRSKLGFHANDATGDSIWKQMEPLIRTSRTDWIVVFRSLTYTLRDFPLASAIEDDEKDDSYKYNQIVAALEGTNTNVDSTDYPGAFYDVLTDKQRTEWIQWIGSWRKALIMSSSRLSTTTSSSSNDRYESMKKTNPKYVLREWMLVDAYTAASNLNDDSKVLEMFELIQNPYDDNDDAITTTKYYKRAPDEALVSGGTAFMSCSS